MLTSKTPSNRSDAKKIHLVVIAVVLIVAGRNAGRNAATEMRRQTGRFTNFERSSHPDRRSHVGFSTALLPQCDICPCRPQDKYPIIATAKRRGSDLQP